MLNPLFLCDFYKIGHVAMYPAGVQQVWSNFTPRSTRISGEQRVTCFGIQYFIKEYLLNKFHNGFFARSIDGIVKEYTDVVQATLGVKSVYTSHIRMLHEYGRMPIDIYAVPEGDHVPLNTPMLVITNTQPWAFWVPNYLETILSNALWKPCTSATTARRYRRNMIGYAKESGETDMGFVDWMGHDFSFRGMSGVEDALLSGMGHLLSFSGTDTIPAILAAEKYYGAKLTVGGSVPATEHSVMSAGNKDGEFETFRRLLIETYPEGILSIVSDTWDLWRVLTDYVPRLREQILNRKGKLVVRPDSGDPVKILCGNPDFANVPNNYACFKDPRHPAYYGTLELLRRALGTEPRGDGGLPMIRNAGAIYGDSITVERADQILSRTVRELKLSPYNVVFGIGSFTYQFVTRDTYGFAMKATAVRKNGVVVPIFKDPITDFGTKKSHVGIPGVYRTEESTDSEPDYFVLQGITPEQLDNCAFRKVFGDGKLLIDEDFETIRKRARR
jgi:nicotinamide phosphoribosyltransferase